MYLVSKAGNNYENQTFPALFCCSKKMLTALACCFRKKNHTDPSLLGKNNHFSKKVESEVSGCYPAHILLPSEGAFPNHRTNTTNWSRTITLKI